MLMYLKTADMCDKQCRPYQMLLAQACLASVVKLDGHPTGYQVMCLILI